MNRKQSQLLKDWRHSTQTAINALEGWNYYLLVLQTNDGREEYPGQFMKEYRILAQNMGDDWADHNPNDLDALRTLAERK